MRLRTNIAAFFLAAAASSMPSSKAAAQDDSRYQTSIYHGPVAKPNFSGAASHYRNLRTVIRQGFSQGVNFAGHYRLIAVGCGASCAFIIVGDLKTGRLFDFPYGGESNPNLDFKSRAASRLVLALWGDGTFQTCISQKLELVGATFKPVGREERRQGPCH